MKLTQKQAVVHRNITHAWNTRLASFPFCCSTLKMTHYLLLASVDLQSGINAFAPASNV